MSPRLQSALVLAGVFALGVITGGFAVRFSGARWMHSMLDAPPHQARERIFLMTLDREVHLDDAQRDKVREILAAHEPEMREIRRTVTPRLAAVRARTDGEIRAVLRPDQVEDFDRFLQKQEARARAAGEAPAEEKPPLPHP